MFLVVRHRGRPGAAARGPARRSPQADELPVAPPHLRDGQALSYRELPLRYFTAGRAPPQRGVGLARRPHPRAPVRAGRRAHLPAWSRRSPDEVQRIVELMKTVYGAFGLEFAAKFSTRPASSGIGDDALWDRPRARCETRSTRIGLPYELKPGRRRVLRPEDRLRRDRLARPQVADLHDPARLRRAGAVRPHLRRRRQHASTGRSSSTARSTARSSASSRS